MKSALLKRRGTLIGAAVFATLAMSQLVSPTVHVGAESTPPHLHCDDGRLWVPGPGHGHCVGNPTPGIGW